MHSYVDNFELVTGLFPYGLYKDDLPFGEQMVTHLLLSIICTFQSIVYYFIFNNIYIFAGEGWKRSVGPIM